MRENRMRKNSTVPVRVLHFVGRLGSGGIERLLVSLQENIDSKVIVFDYLVWSTNIKGLYEDYVQTMQSRIISLDIEEALNPFRRVVKKIHLFNQFIKQADYQILHLHGNRPIIFVYAFFANKAGIKNIIVHSHSDASVPPTFSDIVLPLFKMVLKKYPTFYMACSCTAGAFMIPSSIPHYKKMIFNNGINFDIFRFSHTKRQMIREKLDIEDRFVIGHVGRFSRTKNHTFLLDAYQ